MRTCIHVKTNGIRCNSPALRDSVKCYFHHQHRRLKRNTVIKTLKTRGGRLAAIQQLVHAVQNDRIDPEVARSLLYAIHLATSSKRTPP
jgi:hypothetical protein